jgi:DNA-binding IclR family transcriptional regulator
VPKLATGQTLRSAERMLDVLKVFSTDEAALTMSEISTRLDLAPSTVRRILDALESKGFVRQDPRTGKYSPFVEIVRLAAVAVQGNDLISAASQPLDDLRDNTGENVQLTVLIENDVVFVDRRVTNQTIKIFSPIGYRRPPWDGRASGQVLLA